jgi:branched-chain amino acid transport system ATP-binding protein
MLRISGLTAGYGAVPALLDVDLEVGAGELVTVVGSNGAGKSTLLRTFSKLITPMRGRIEFDGSDLTKLRPDQVVARGLVHCPEGRHVFPALSVRDNLRMGALGRRKQFERQIDEVYALFPRLAERPSQLAGSLSGGEQQMLAVGRSLMADPRMVMLDEPSLGLAPLAIEQVLAAAAAIRDRGRTVLLVEQNAELALDIADRAYVLERGRIVAHGTSAELAGSQEIRTAYLGG